MTLTFAIFGLDSGALNTAVELLLLAFVVVWLALVWFTFADARRRISDPLLIGSAALAAVIFPFVGTLVYLIVRPPEYLEDVRERDLEMQAAEARLQSLDYQLCSHCDEVVGRDYLRCPHCARKLRDTCGSCAKPLDPDWVICPYCEAEIPGVTPQRGGGFGGDDLDAGDAGGDPLDPGDAYDAPALEAYEPGPEPDARASESQY